jgi:hypothetical protein
MNDFEEEAAYGEEGEEFPAASTAAPENGFGQQQQQQEHYPIRKVCQT